MFPKMTKILIVDDAKAMRRIVSKMFKDMGYENILEASNGSEAWEVISKGGHGVGLVISDWNMPNSTGLDLVRRIRADRVYSAMPFLLCTTEAEEHQVKEAALAGIDSFVVKPFTVETLTEKLAAVYKRRFQTKGSTAA